LPQWGDACASHFGSAPRRAPSVAPGQPLTPRSTRTAAAAQC